VPESATRFLILVEGRVVDAGRRDEARDGLERRYERAVAWIGET
jgi:hypothetical protein